VAKKKRKPSDIIYDMAGQYDNERGRNEVVPSEDAMCYAIIQFLDENFKQI